MVEEPFPLYIGIVSNRKVKVTELDATATGSDEIGKAFQKVGGSAGALDLSFEKTASWIAVLSSRTREGKMCSAA